ncbi:MAG: hypothetical protein R3D63_07160 [Paracoccaceae bacterium]
MGGRLLDLGTYMQTAAHTELAVWQTTMLAEGIDPHSPVDYRGYVNIKLRTAELLRRFRGSAASCPAWLADRIQEVADEVERGLETRNLAAHGAFFLDDPGKGTLGAAHYFARGQGRDRELFEIKQAVTRQQVEDAIRAGNQLLHSVIALRQAIQDWRYPNGTPDPSPLPTCEDQRDTQ